LPSGAGRRPPTGRRFSRRGERPRCGPEGRLEDVQKVLTRPGGGPPSQGSARTAQWHFVTRDEFLTILVTSAVTSCLGWLATVGVWLLQQRRSDRDARIAARSAAYADLARLSLDFLLLVGSIAETLHLRTGVKESWAVFVGHRRPVEPLEFFTVMREQFKPLNAAWSTVYAHGSQEGIRLADDLLLACGDLMTAATSGNEDRPYVARLVFGEKWTDNKSAQYQGAADRVARIRADLLHLVRAESGRDPVSFAIDSPASVGGSA